MNGVRRFNEAEAGRLRPELSACCDVPAWVEAVLADRPYASLDDLMAAADSAARRLTHEEVDRALAAHPRIGDRAEGSGAGAGWSRQEQAGVGPDEQTQRDLVAGNREYEQRFGRVFLISATGLAGEQILASLRERLRNDQAAEAAVVAEELRKIALLRLRKLIEDGVQL
ncbi:2-oxo-4-hydroxy-4-carboxy-5-ureidoimidazoline decarboxylase [Intrasporangium sp. DVR]|uniref:2-oxo-4-hydroxy-4-carboxy-5-ureidoimidazoline decarboxylase n=1 Tax=Intrasporangium sp. DVR TaxID=3127867 RepID=UPI00313A553D